MSTSEAKVKDFVRESLSLTGKESRIPLVISLLFFLTTAGWILFEHAFLPWSPISKDFFWAVLSALVLFLLLSRGVSAIRKSETAMRDSEARLARILETSAAGIVVVDRKGDIAYANLEAAAILGDRRSDMVGRNYREHFRAPADEDRLFSRVAETGEPVYGAEMSVLRRDGSRAALSANLAPFADASGNPAGVIVSFFDVTSRREAEELHLRKLYMAAEQSPNGIAITDAAGRIEYANPMFVRVTGYPLKGLIHAFKPCPTDLSPQECRQIRDAVASGKPWMGEYWNRRRNGELYWESAALTPIRDAEGAVAHFLWVAQDVTDQRLAEDALKESQGRYQNMVENIHDLVWEVDRDISFTYVSPRVRDLLGFEPEEVLGRTPYDLMPSFEANRVTDLVAPVIAGRLPFEHIESIFRHRDGRYLVFTSSGIPFHDAGGTFLGWRGVSRDVSRLKRDEEALRQSEERFRQIFEQNEEAVILFRHGTAEVIDANPAAVALYGHGLEELKEGGPSLFVPPGEQARFVEEIRAIGPARSLTVEEASQVRKDGTGIVVSIRGKSIRLQEGYVSYCTFRDITARVRAEEEAREKQAQLIHANRMTSLGTMVSGVAHEINNPNNLIMFNAPLVQAAWTDADRVLASYLRENGDFSLGGLPYSEMRQVVPKLLAGVSESSFRIRNIVEKLKNFARRDKENLECGVDLNEVVRASAAILNHEIVKGCSDFRLDLGENLPMVRGCAQQLEQVIVNLLMNSLQALPDRERGIRVASLVNRETGRVEVHVADEGVGMPPEVMRRLSEPFFSTKLESGGLGLGLSISSSIIREHNGTLEFASEVGRGTTARITLPPVDETMEGSRKVSVPAYPR